MILPAEYYLMNTLGEVTDECLRKAVPASVMGCTSRGVFLKTSGEPEWILFVSYGVYRSPLTITLLAPPARAWDFAPGDRVHLMPDRLVLPGVEVGWRGEAGAERPVWRGESPVIRMASREQTRRNLLEAVRAAAGQRPEDYFCQVLAAFLEMEAPGGLPEDVKQTVRRLELILDGGGEDREGMFSSLRVWFEEILGKGEGLTPVWDDFITGFLLVVGRYGGKGKNKNGWKPFGWLVYQTALKRTTTLSANMIFLAGQQGKADERLTTLLDGLVGAEGASVKQAAEVLSMYGHTSGTAALAGMAAGLAALRIV